MASLTLYRVFPINGKSLLNSCLTCARYISCAMSCIARFHACCKFLGPVCEDVALLPVLLYADHSAAILPLGVLIQLAYSILEGLVAGVVENPHASPVW